MKYSTIFTAAAMASVASAHATLWEAIVDGVSGGSDGRGVYIRAPKNNAPLKDLASTDLRCNVGGGSAVPKTIAAKPGSKITLEWHHDSDAPADDTIDGSHKGPLITYLAPAASNGVGNVWVKIAQDGYSGGSWAVDKLKAANGAHTITLPANLANGDYLLRDEILAHHESDTTFNVNPARGTQLYMGCVQIKVTGAGSTTLPAGVAFPGAYSYADAGIHFNLYGADASAYKIPGPAVWNGVGGSAPAPAPTAAPTTLRTTTRPAAPATTSKAAPVVPQPTTTKAPVVVAPQPTKPVQPAPQPTTSKKAACPIKTSLTSSAKPAATAAPAAGTAAKWAQCGGIGSVAKTCVSGTKCVKQNDWYSQCL